MIVFYAILLIICLIGLRRNKMSNSFLPIRETTTINGIFVIVIFLGHASQYLNLENNILNRLFFIADGQIGQLCVAPFLFFSGYGVMESVKYKTGYIDQMPINRILITLLNFDIAILLFAIVNVTLGIKYDIKTYLLALIGVEHIGNSNWYIFAILVMYIVTYVVGKATINRRYMPWYQVVICLLYIVCAKYLFKFPSRFYTTVMCYPFGMIISNYKEKIKELIEKYKICMALTVFSVFVLIMILHLRQYDIIYNIYSCLFMLIIVLIMHELSVNSKSLYYLGKHCFSIYVLQRIPMILMSHYFGKDISPYIFIPLTLCVTLVLSYIYDKFTGKMDIKIKRLLGNEAS